MAALRNFMTKQIVLSFLLPVLFFLPAAIGPGPSGRCQKNQWDLIPAKRAARYHHSVVPTAEVRLSWSCANPSASQGISKDIFFDLEEDWEIFFATRPLHHREIHIPAPLQKIGKASFPVNQYNSEFYLQNRSIRC